MEWNGNFGMEYGRCQNGMEDFKNEMEDNLPYQFHTRFRALYLLKNIYRCQVVTNNIVTTSISTSIICQQIVVVWLCRFIGQMVYVLHHSKYRRYKLQH